MARMRPRGILVQATRLLRSPRGRRAHPRSDWQRAGPTQWAEALRRRGAGGRLTRARRSMRRALHSRLRMRLRAGVPPTSRLPLELRLRRLAPLWSGQRLPAPARRPRQAAQLAGVPRQRLASLFHFLGTCSTVCLHQHHAARPQAHLHPQLP